MARSRDYQEKAKPRSDAYVGLLLIALLAQIAAAVFFFLDYQQYPANKPPAVEAPRVGQPQQPPGGVVPNPGAGGGQAGMAGQAGMGGGQAGMAGQAGMGGGMAGMGGGNVGNQGGGNVGN